MFSSDVEFESSIPQKTFIWNRLRHLFFIFVPIIIINLRIFNLWEAYAILNVIKTKILVDDQRIFTDFSEQWSWKFLFFVHRHGMIKKFFSTKNFSRKIIRIFQWKRALQEQKPPENVCYKFCQYRYHYISHWKSIMTFEFSIM